MIMIKHQCVYCDHCFVCVQEVFRSFLHQSIVCLPKIAWTRKLTSRITHSIRWTLFTVILSIFLAMIAKQSFFRQVLDDDHCSFKFLSARFFLPPPSIVILAKLLESDISLPFAVLFSEPFHVLRSSYSLWGELFLYFSFWCFPQILRPRKRKWLSSKKWKNSNLIIWSTLKLKKKSFFPPKRWSKRKRKPLKNNLSNWSSWWWGSKRKLCWLLI